MPPADADMDDSANMADSVKPLATAAGDVLLTAVIARTISGYHGHDVAAEFQRLLALAKWDVGLERWRKARNPVAYLTRVVLNSAREMLRQEYPRGFDQLSTREFADEGTASTQGYDLRSMDADMRKVVEARIQGTPWRDVSHVLGWGDNFRRVERARGRLRRSDPPRTPATSGVAKRYRERLSSGAWVHSFQSADFELLENLIAAERIQIKFYSARTERHFAPPNPNTRGTTFVTNPTELKAKLLTEIAHRDRVAERVRILRESADEADRDLRAARAELSVELTAAPLEDRTPRTETFEKKITKLQAAHDSKRAELLGAQSALQQLNEKVEAVDAEIKANEKSRVLKTVAPLIGRFTQMRNETAMLGEEIRQALRGHYVDAQELFPEEHEVTRLLRLTDLYHAQAQFLGGLAMYNPRLRGDLFRKYPNSMPETWAMDT